MPKHTGRKAIVVGGTTRVGLAIAKRLVEGGAHVLLIQGWRHEVPDAAEQLGRAATLTLCAMSAGALTQAAAAHSFGAIDMLFVDAEPDPGTTGPRPYAVAVRALAPLVTDDGSVVLTTTSVDRCLPGMPDAGAHATTAAATRAFARALAVELAPRGVRVNTVSPGAIDTAAHDDTPAPRPATAPPPLGRRGSVDDVARAALFLAADATFTTGSVLSVDGGLGCADSRRRGCTEPEH
ncbi:SDR family oxidoreductase [Streptomyces xanthii]|uniref:SDR family oxidoreductase n=1 Tax=Streptomyces xanthii TaxID=2768069 RepID=A0A7H1BHC3_9ACTN|nr:SDR family oxidoreductase [Streptomyces xanthii]QNS08128.1 SDR family oxidoreductase [Streptomyces xanthii]